LGFDLTRDVFLPVLKRVKERADSLVAVKRFPRSGIEGWFKVEIVAVLDSKVRALCNRGPDLVLEDGTCEGMPIELKASTNFDKRYVVDPVTKYGCACLFLGDGTGRTGFEATSSEGFDVVRAEVFQDPAGGSWLMGLVKPRPNRDD